jgi:NAD(P)-dependent dehydrogenase (short-subunit alcohol dehydrogenase family)
VLTWADEVRTTPLKVNLFDPGPTATRLRSNAMPGEDPSTVTRPSEVAPVLATLCSPDEMRHGDLIRFAPG